MAFNLNTLSEHLVHASTASRLDQALSHRTTLPGSPRDWHRRRPRTSDPYTSDPYAYYLIARGAIR